MPRESKKSQGKRKASFASESTTTRPKKWSWTSEVAEIRVPAGPGKPGNSWNFIMAFSRTGKSWKTATGPGKFLKFVKLG